MEFFWALLPQFLAVLISGIVSRYVMKKENIRMAKLEEDGKKLRIVYFDKLLTKVFLGMFYFVVGISILFFAFSFYFKPILEADYFIVGALLGISSLIIIICTAFFAFFVFKKIWYYDDHFVVINFWGRRCVYYYADIVKTKVTGNTVLYFKNGKKFIVFNTWVGTNSFLVFLMSKVKFEIE